MASKPLIQCFIDDINVVIDKYRDTGITVGEMIGAFQVLVFDLWLQLRGANMDRGGDLPQGFPDQFPEGDN